MANPEAIGKVIFQKNKQNKFSDHVLHLVGILCIESNSFFLFSLAYQTQQVTTEVFPSEMGEGEIPWWVWLLAALLGLLLLAIITLCLYKVKIDYLK